MLCAITSEVIELIHVGPYNDDRHV